MSDASWYPTWLPGASYSRRPQHSLVLNTQRHLKRHKCLCLGTWIAPRQSLWRATTFLRSPVRQADALPNRQGRKRWTLSFFSAVKFLQLNLWILTFWLWTKQSYSKSKYFLKERKVCILRILAKCCTGSVLNSFLPVFSQPQIVRDTKTYLPTIRQQENKKLH